MYKKSAEPDGFALFLCDEYNNTRQFEWSPDCFLSGRSRELPLPGTSRLPPRDVLHFKQTTASAYARCDGGGRYVACHRSVLKSSVALKVTIISYVTLSATEEPLLTYPTERSEVNGDVVLLFYPAKRSRKVPVTNLDCQVTTPLRSHKFKLLPIKQPLVTHFQGGDHQECHE